MSRTSIWGPVELSAASNGRSVTVFGMTEISSTSQRLAAVYGWFKLCCGLRYKQPRPCVYVAVVIYPGRASLVTTKIISKLDISTALAR